MCNNCKLVYKARYPYCPSCGIEMEYYDEFYIKAKRKDIITDDYNADMKVAVKDKYSPYGGCANCKHHEDPEAVCIARLCIHAINELTDSYEPKEK